ncbi:hypothetical protein DL762_004163 [Monosporascus cannonballus]|uniref:Importin N-terminal domain-containing protein n=1 Tax=Monosporascus cannonballus TaxID=155416 RepID=A0ABY0HD07_9PEZI|nr:hypothetical protein DL762_004163 [Monosporascus cannonballus]
MNFAIEVPGEANPLSLQELYRVLQSASSHDYSQRQSAGQQLSAWEAHRDYYPALQAVFLDKTLPREIRLLAIIQLKNGIDRFWRHHTLKNAIQPAQKETIRSNLFYGTIGEEDRQLALHNALVFAKVLRIDFPQDWPDPLAKLVDVLRESKDGNQLHLTGALLLLLRIVKELGAARLRKSQTALQSATPELVYVLGEIYGVKTSEWIGFLRSESGDKDGAMRAMECSLTALKILRRLLIVGYEYPHKDKTVQQVWSFSQTQFGEFLGFTSPESPVPAVYQELVGKHLLQFTKFHLEMAEKHAASFASLPNSLDLARGYWDLVAKFAEVFDKSGGIRQGSASDSATKPKAEGPLIEKLALKGLLLMRACLKMVHHPSQTIKYRSRDVIEEQKEAIDVVRKDLLTDALITQMANVIITNLFIFRKSDLEAWEEDPEEWEQQEESQGSAWEWEVRPCAEKLFLDLLTNYKALLLQPLLAYFATVRDPRADIGAKEAVYTAMGLAAPLVHEEFDFDDVLKSTIVGDAQLTVPYCQVIRRRIGILLSQWTPVRATKESRPLIYEIYRRFLDPNDSNNDIVVRITAGRQLKAVVDEFGFDGEMFLPFASDVLTELVRLLQGVVVEETKLAILETTRSLIERMETHVSGFGDFIITALPGVWDSAGELGFMLKQAVMAILQALVVSMKSDSQKYQPQILPLVAQATTIGSDLYLYLAEDALDLWYNTLLQSSPPLSAELLGLIEPAVGQLAANNEHVFQYTSIVGSYVILAPEVLLEDRFRKPVVNAFSAALNSKSREQLNITTKYMEAYIRYAHELGGNPGLQFLVQDMLQTGFLSKILEGIHDAYEAHQTSGPNRKQPRVNNLGLTDYFVILSRITVIDPSIFMEMLTSFGPIEQVWTWLSEEWFRSFDNTADVHRLKLNMLALTRLLELPQPVQDLVLAKLQDYFSMWTGVMVQVLGEGQTNPDGTVPQGTVDTLVLTEKLPDTEWDTPKDVKERALFSNDPVTTVQSLPFVKERLHRLVERIGGLQAFHDNWLINVDRDVINGFEALGTSQPQS